MWSSRLWIFLSAMSIVILLATLTIKYSLNDNAQWQVISARGLHTKIQTGLTQIYWQWQQRGRPQEIEFRPENQAQGFVIKMSERGVPQISLNKTGCEQLLSWFVEQEILDNQLHITTQFISDKSANNTYQFSDTARLASENLCKFEYAKRVFYYHLLTGELNISS